MTHEEHAQRRLDAIIAEHTDYAEQQGAEQRRYDAAMKAGDGATMIAAKHRIADLVEMQRATAIRRVDLTAAVAEARAGDAHERMRAAADRATFERLMAAQEAARIAYEQAQRERVAFQANQRAAQYHWEQLHEKAREARQQAQASIAALTQQAQQHQGAA